MTIDELLESLTKLREECDGDEPVIYLGEWQAVNTANLLRRAGDGLILAIELCD